MAKWLTEPSVKAQAVVALIKRHLIDKREKIAIWATEPPVLMCLEIMLKTLQANVVVIRAGKKNSERVQAEMDFNYNPKVEIILLSVVSAQESMNLQKGGHIMICVDPMPMTALIQCVGRMGRIGQEFAQIIYNLVVDDTYDQVLQSVYMERYRVIVAATTEVRKELAKQAYDACTVEEKEQFVREAAESGGSLSRFDCAMAKLRGAFADAIMRNLFGLRSSRHGDWRADDTKAKNLMPEETLFRLAHGGSIANEMMAQIHAEQAKSKEAEDIAESVNKVPSLNALPAHPFVQNVLYSLEAPAITNAREAEEACIQAAETMTQGLEYRTYGITAERKSHLAKRIELPASSSVCILRVS